MDKFPSIENMFNCKVIIRPDGLSCILCGDYLESDSHLFIICSLTSTVRYTIFKWLDFPGGASQRAQDYFWFFLYL